MQHKKQLWNRFRKPTTLSCCGTRNEVWICNWICWTFTERNSNHYSLTELHTPKITVTTGRIKSSQCLLAVAWQRLLTTDVSIPMGSWTLPASATSSQPAQQLSKSNLCYDQRLVGRSILVSSPIWGPKSDFCYCQTVAGLLMWGALSDGRTGLSFTIVNGPRQRRHSHIRFQRDS
jgi:hypothetical protein